MITIVNVGYRSTNFYVVSAGRSRLLVDLGWPGTFGTLRANLARKDVPLSEIRYGLATHYHMDHAGLAQELKLAGVPLLVVAGQEPAIPLLKQHMKPEDRFVDITLHDNVTITTEGSRAFLAKIGIEVRSFTRRVTPTTACRCCSTTVPCLPGISRILPS